MTIRTIHPLMQPPMYSLTQLLIPQSLADPSLCPHAQLPIHTHALSIRASGYPCIHLISQPVICQCVHPSANHPNSL